MINMLKYLIVLSLVLSISECGPNKKLVKIPPELMNAVFPAAQQCMSETGVGLDAMLAVFQGKYFKDQKFKDFLYCCYSSTGYLKQDGYLDVDKASSAFENEPIVADGVKRCGQEPGNNGKDALFNFFKCFQDTVPLQFTL